MKIGVYDKDKEISEYLSNVMLNNQKNYIFEIVQFNDIKAFMRANICDFDILVLDNKRNDEDSFKSTVAIKENIEKVLLFSSDFKIIPFSQKFNDLNKDEFNKKLALALCKLNNEKTLFKLNTHTNVSLDSITYVEYLNRKLAFHLGNDTIQSYGTMKDTIQYLHLYDFVRCHAAFIVNMNSIKTIKAYNIVLTDGTSIPISKQNSTRVRQSYNIYLAREALNFE